MEAERLDDTCFRSEGRSPTRGGVSAPGENGLAIVNHEEKQKPSQPPTSKRHTLCPPDTATTTIPDEH